MNELKGRYKFGILPPFCTCVPCSELLSAVTTISPWNTRRTRLINSNSRRRDRENCPQGREQQSFFRIKPPSRKQQLVYPDQTGKTVLTTSLKPLLKQGTEVMIHWNTSLTRTVLLCTPHPLL
jgi:hypothetical protein